MTVTTSEVYNLAQDIIVIADVQVGDDTLLLKNAA